MTPEPKDVQLARLPEGFAWNTDSGSLAIVSTVDHPQTSTRLNDGAIITIDGRRAHGVNVDVALALIDAAGRNATADRLRKATVDALECIDGGIHTAAEIVLKEALEVETWNR